MKKLPNQLAHSPKNVSWYLIGSIGMEVQCTGNIIWGIFNRGHVWVTEGNSCWTPSLNKTLLPSDDQRKILFFRSDWTTVYFWFWMGGSPANHCKPSNHLQCSRWNWLSDKGELKPYTQVHSNGLGKTDTTRWTWLIMTIDFQVKIEAFMNWSS